MNLLVSECGQPPRISNTNQIQSSLPNGKIDFDLICCAHWGPKRTVQQFKIKRILINWICCCSCGGRSAPTKSTLHSINKRKIKVFLFWFHEVDWFLLANGGPSPQRKQIKFNWKWICLISFVGQWARAAIQLINQQTTKQNKLKLF